MTRHCRKWPDIRGDGAEARNLRRAVERIYRAICPDAFERWSTLLWESAGIDPEQRQPFHERIARLYGIELPDDRLSGSKLLFAIQTFFAGVVKQIVRQELDGLELSDRFFNWTERENTGKHYFCDIKYSNERLDFFATAYQCLYPASARKALGEFYTPGLLAKFLVQKLGRFGEPLLDPACGSGVFLLAAADEMLRAGFDSETITQRLRGFDLNPLAVLMGRANLALMLGIKDESRLPIFLRDSIRGQPLPGECQAFNLIGNPPWLNWDRLPRDYRDKTLSLWHEYGLFNLAGNDARHGGAKKELAQLFILRVADQYLKRQGRSLFVLPMSVFQTRKAGEGFRRFRLPDGTPLGVLAVDDFSVARPNPFSTIGTKAASMLFEKGSETKFPVPCFRRTTQERFDFLEGVPIDPSKPGSAWMFRKISQGTDENDLKTDDPTPQTEGYCSKTLTSRLPIDQGPTDRGPSDYRAFLGANTGGANGVFWLEILGASERSERLVRVRNLAECGKLTLPKIEAEIEKELVFPLLCWKDIDRFRTKTSNRFILLPQDEIKRTGIDPGTMHEKYPNTLAYLKRFKQQLLARAAFRAYQFNAPFYSMYNIGRQTFAPIKVVWRRMDKILRAAVVETLEHPLLGSKPIIPQETCVLIPCDTRSEADYLVEQLNSEEIGLLVESFGTAGSKGFGSPGLLEHLGIRRFSPEHFIAPPLQTHDDKYP